MGSTIRESLQIAIADFKDAGITTASLDARVLLGVVLEVPANNIVLHMDDVLSGHQHEMFMVMVQRRCKREPVSKILGTREFWGLSFFVTENTLDPRPDSEALIEAILELGLDLEAPLRVLDLGTGTGCLLLTILHLFKNASGLGIDRSLDALAIAGKNAKNLGLENRASFKQSSWFEEVNGRFDLIISNPPYIPKGDIAELEPEVKDFDPIIALSGGADGLACYNSIIPASVDYMAEGAFIALEHGEGQSACIQEMLKLVQLQVITQKQDLAGLDRCVVASKRLNAK